jgi:hypothetical protein
MKKIIKGSAFGVGDHVNVVINDGYGTTTINGIITGVQFWNPSLIAIQFAGIGDWIKITDFVEIGRIVE